jgi:hypothetical protein
VEQPDEKPLTAILDRLDRAQEHLEAIKLELIAYYSSDCCHLSGKHEPDEEEGESSVMLAPLGDRLNTLIGEFLHNTRSALDHLAWQLVLRSGGKPSGATNFPILTQAPTTKRQGTDPLPNVTGGVSQEARAVIDEAQPYKWSVRARHHPLWVLHQLWNIDKHRHVLARGGHFQAHFRGWNVPAYTYTARFDSATEYEAKFILVPDDPNVQVDADAAIKVTLSEPEYGIEQQLIGTLEQILQAVVRMVTTAEDRCF